MPTTQTCQRMGDRMALFCGPAICSVLLVMATWLALVSPLSADSGPAGRWLDGETGAPLSQLELTARPGQRISVALEFVPETDGGDLQGVSLGLTGQPAGSRPAGLEVVWPAAKPNLAPGRRSQIEFDLAVAAFMRPGRRHLALTVEGGDGPAASLPLTLDVTGPVSPDWNADAGLIPSLAAGVAVSATSQQDAADHVVDGDAGTHWQSAACLPTGYITRPELNVLLGACDRGGCTSSAANDMADGVDGSFFSGAGVQAVDGLAWLEVALPAPQVLLAVGARGITAGEIAVQAITASGAITVGLLTGEDNYQFRRFDPPVGPVSALRVSSADDFTLTELTGLGQPCFEAVTVDLGAVQEIGWVRTRHWSGGRGISTTLSASLDGLSWETLAELDPDALSLVSTLLDPPRSLRFLRVQHTVEMVDWAKVYVWEVEAFDRDGPYGPAAAVAVNPHSLAELLGVNGIWGWGTSSYSDSLGPGEGPDMYNAFAGHGRNYHNMTWDVSDPDHVPDYETMAAGGGTEAQWWLNWDREYGAWLAAGLPVEASIQFLERTVPQASWDDPALAGYNYGYAFARHFGPTAGTGHVHALEVGNEPWDYPADFYREVLGGMALGAKDGDPAMLVLPAAFQADEPEKPGASGGNYLSARLTAIEAGNIDALNAHAYSFAYAADGARIAVHPEAPESYLHSVRNVRRFRDANLPDAPIYLTEWGWDSSGAGETCSHDECVSEEAQALYAVRGALMLAREGLDRLTWYFYANSHDCDTLFCRSGVTGSANTGFAPKQSFTALQALVGTLGDRHFIDVLREDDDAWIYLLGEADGRATHLVGWRPVDAGVAATVTVTATVPGSPGMAWRLAGLSSTGESVPSPAAAGSEWTLPLSATPLVVRIEPLLCDASGLGEFIWPTCEAAPPPQSSPFGPRQMASEGFRYDWHRGVDIPMPLGSPVYATADGVVRIAGEHEAYSDLLVQLRHRDSAPYLYSNYLHLSGVAVAENDPVSAGDLIGYSGASASGFEHLHFEFREGCLYQDCNRNPWAYLPYIDEAPGQPLATGANLGDSATLLLELSTPAGQLDLEGLDLDWGGQSLQVSFNAINATGDRNRPELLDHPAIELDDGVTACLFPARFSTSYDSADYYVALSGLDGAAISGSAAQRDLHGLGSALVFTPTLPSLTLSPAGRIVDVPPGSPVTLTYTLQNSGSLPLTPTLSVQSAQNNPLSLSHAQLMLSPGASQTVSVTLQLSPAQPAGVGDCLLIEAGAGGDWAMIAFDNIVTSCYDFNDTGLVDALDIQAVAGRWYGDYDPGYDLIPDRVIDLLDIMAVAARFNQSCD